MRSKSIKILSIILIALLGYIVAKSYYPLLNFSWDGFELVTIKSSIDSVDQLAYFHSTSSQKPMPLFISLHSWGASYSYKDHIALLSKKKDLNYIHPDFRGPNYSQAGCLSEIVLNDIDDAISYAITNGNVDLDEIYIIGFSGGGYATLGTYMKSKHKIKAFSAWASITDLAAWYEESRIRKNKYAADIFKCTDSENEFNTVFAKERSPLFMELPDQSKSSAKLFLYAGVHDGIDGSVPITHSINFYNRMLSDLNIEDSSKYVSKAETEKLLEHRKPLLDFGRLKGTWRDICLQKETDYIKLVIYDGNHEILTEYAFNELLAN